MTIDDCRMIEFPRMVDPEGSLTFIEGERHVPFELKRVFYIYDVPTAESRGAHAHKELQQVLICLSGSFDVLLDDGEQRREIRMNRPWRGLYVPRMIWAAIINFDPGSVCLVLASERYSETDYYRDYQEYLRAKREEDALLRSCEVVNSDADVVALEQELDILPGGVEEPWSDGPR